MPHGTSELKCTTKCGLIGRVVSHDAICHEHVALTLCVPDFTESQPGQFVQVLCAPVKDASQTRARRSGECSSAGSSEQVGEPAAFLRRPFSIADSWLDDGVRHVLLISRCVGPGTAWLERLHTGDAVDITGPLGNGFKIPSLGPPIVLMGGGVGIPPLLYLARVLHDYGHEDVTVIFGATRSDLLPMQLLTEPDRGGAPLVCAALRGDAAYPTAITTDDGSRGLRGVVTDALRIWHSTRRLPASSVALVFACGPEPMLRAVTVETRKLNLQCQLCIERHMGCGLGTCLSCVVRVRDGNRAEGWRWGLTCTDGPVFDRDALWEPGDGDCQVDVIHG